MTPTITLHTRLNSAIYQSEGGGQDRIIQSWALGPRNLRAAVIALEQERADSCRAYGNVGCGYSWLEIGGIRVQAHNLRFAGSIPTVVECRDLIAVYSSEESAAESLASYERACAESELQYAQYRGWVRQP